jgi:hypothetical protein
VWHRNQEAEEGRGQKAEVTSSFILHPSSFIHSTDYDGQARKGAGMRTRTRQDKAFDAFYDTARQNGILDSKTTIMLHLATAMSAGCYP